MEIVKQTSEASRVDEKQTCEDSEWLTVKQTLLAEETSDSNNISIRSFRIMFCFRTLLK